MGVGVRVILTMVAIAVAFVPARAQEASRTIRQFQHTTWTARDGAPPEIWALDQGPDGFLWLGTGSGLYRFDGVTFERYPLARGERLASIDITAVKALASGEIWVGYSDGGVSRLQDGRATTFTEADGIWPGMVVRFCQDGEGVLWAVSHGGLARFVGGRWRRVGADWHVPAELTVELFVARDGVLWLSTARSIYFSRPGSRRFEATGAVAEHATFTQTPDGRMWIADGLHGLRPLPDYVAGDRRGPWRLGQAARGNALATANFAVDPQGVVWGTDRVNGGIFRFDPLQARQPTHSVRSSDVDVFRRADGLTADRSIPILSDREGNVWVGTNAGLDRFRRSDVVPEVAVPPPTASGYSIAALPDATYITDGAWLYRVPPHQSARRLARLPVRENTVLFASRDGALWYGNGGVLHRVRNGAVSRVGFPETARGEHVDAIAEDGAGRLWVAFTRAGVHRLSGGAWTGRVDLGDLPTPTVAASDPTGVVWFGYAGNRVSRHDAAGMRVFSAGDGLAVGNVEGIAVRDGAVWVGGELGVARLEGERFRTIGPDRVAPLVGVSGIGRATDGAMLLNGLMGVAKLPEDELRKAFGDSSYAPAYELYDRRDGVPGVAQQGWHSPTVVAAGDGRSWVISNTGVFFLEPRARVRNTVPPPVSIVSATTGSVGYPTAGAITLPAGSTSLAIGYTAAALRTPEGVRFRHRLDGLDRDWVDAAGRREAVYGNLGPGQYHFRVIAANEDGVWNETGAALDVEIPPTFLQSEACKALVGGALATLLWLAYARRMRNVAERIHGRMTERMEERERIARELHDTLLQSVQALTLRFQRAVDELPERLPVRESLAEAIDRADAVIAEGRDHIRALRLIRDGSVEDMVADVVRRQAFGDGVEVVVTSAGTPRALEPLVLDEVTRIAREAVFNVWRHARATRVAVDIRHGVTFGLRVADNGVGIDPRVVARGEREGHFGLPGMRESARRLRGAVELRAMPGGGTEVALTVPASIAYKRRTARALAFRSTA